MRYGVIAENPMERIGLASGLVPTPMLEPYGAGFGRTLHGGDQGGRIRWVVGH